MICLFRLIGNNGKVFKLVLSIFFMRIKKVTEVIGSKVYTDTGEFFGEIEEANLFENKVDGWRIKVGSSVMSLIGGAKGVIIPHQFVRAIGDVFIINRSALPSSDGLDEMPADLM